MLPRSKVRATLYWWYFGASAGSKFDLLLLLPSRQLLRLLLLPVSPLSTVSVAWLSSGFRATGASAFSALQCIFCSLEACSPFVFLSRASCATGAAAFPEAC